MTDDTMTDDGIMPVPLPASKRCSPTCEYMLAFPDTHCGRCSEWAYPSAGGGWAALCDIHADHLKPMARLFAMYPVVSGVVQVAAHPAP